MQPHFNTWCILKCAPKENCGHSGLNTLSAHEPVNLVGGLACRYQKSNIRHSELNGHYVKHRIRTRWFTIYPRGWKTCWAGYLMTTYNNALVCPRSSAIPGRGNLFPKWPPSVWIQRWIIMAALRNRAGHYIFILWFLCFFISIFFPPILSRRGLNVYHTSTHDVNLVWI